MSKSFPTKQSVISLLPNLLIVVVCLAVLLFLPAGRLDWFQAWAFVLAFSGFLIVYGLWVVRNDPGQMDERSRGGQNTKRWDKVILTAYTILLLAKLILAGLDAGRFRWAPAPLLLQGLGWLGVALAGSVVWWTVSVKPFLSRTVRIQDDRGQRVIDSVPYARVRHPMYLGIIFLMVSIPRPIFVASVHLDSLPIPWTFSVLLLPRCSVLYIAHKPVVIRLQV